jgi:hypothetical protein
MTAADLIDRARRALAARVPLWRELEERGWSFVDDVHADLDGEAMVVDRDMLRALRETLDSLAALDEKGGAE